MTRPIGPMLVGIILIFILISQLEYKALLQNQAVWEGVEAAPLHLIFKMMTVALRFTHSYQLQVAMVAMELLLLDIKIQTRRKDVQMV
jgi:hypothetical protein